MEERPTRLFLSGDIEKSKTFVGEAKKMIFQLGLLQDMGSEQNVLKQGYDDGTEIKVVTGIGGIDQIYIQSERPAPIKIEVTHYDFPVPVIALSSNIDITDFVGGYVAENFIDDYKEYVEKDSDEKIEYEDMPVSVAVRGDLVPLKAVGDHALYTESKNYYECNKIEFSPPESFSQEILPDPCESESVIGPYRSTCIPEEAHYCTCPCVNNCPACEDCHVYPLYFGCVGYNVVWFVHSGSVFNFPVYMERNTHVDSIEVQQDFLNVSFSTGYNLPIVCGTTATYVYPPTFHDTVYYCSNIVDNRGVVFIDNTGYGEPGSKIFSYTQTGSFNSTYSVAITMEGIDLSVEGEDIKIGYGSYTYNIITGLCTWNSQLNSGEGIISRLDSAAWLDENSGIILYTKEIGPEGSSSGQFYGTPIMYPIAYQAGLTGSKVQPSQRIVVIELRAKTPENDWLIVSVTVDRTLHSNSYTIIGDVEVFDYNKTPFYMFRVCYGESVRDGILVPAEELTHEYGCIYKNEINKIRFKGVANDLISGLDQTWAHSLTNAVAIDNDGVETEVDLPKTVIDKFGGSCMTDLKILAGKYEITEVINAN
jgi:hypothetical protein